MKDLGGLIARVEQATGPDRELFREAWHACCADEAEPFSAELAAEARFFALVSVEAFVDAAIGLMERVLPSYDYILEHTNDGLTISALVGTADPGARVFATTLPLAIILATLRALQSKPEGDAR